ncbi:MAG: ABC transporter ATP-binding protein [Defluviitaleaceae bacterium]|nr:ABC transporter ATP-binding protein [Defluviitaleaceae bacterium]
MGETPAIQTHRLTKTFDQVVANDHVSFDVQRGEILALLGENGSGKTTLMNMLSGIYFPDSGEIEVHGTRVAIRSPKDAFALGIGMVHQHFKLVDVLTATENILLGLPGKALLDRRGNSQEIREISKRYGFELNPEKKIYNMSVSEKQTVEIVKVLYRGADILILDEPTAVLTPQETTRLFVTLRNMRDDGKAIVIITHKLHEVLAVSDRVHIMRKGKSIATVATSETNQQELTEMMVGRTVSLKIDRPTTEGKVDRLSVQNLNCLTPDGVKALQDVSFTLQSGEILGVAGIAGSGQKELCEALAGLYPITGGTITYHHGEAGGNTNITGKTPKEIQQQGIAMAFVPEDRLGMGLVANMDMTDNVMLRYYDKSKGPFVDRKSSRALAENLITQLAVVTPGASTPVRRLSGGNVQKVLLGREIASAPRVLIVAYPVRGLDINSSYTIYDLLNEQKKKGVAVLFVGEDLDVLLELADRILVLCGGQVSGIVDATETTKEAVGLLMTQMPTAGEVAAT